MKEDLRELLKNTLNEDENLSQEQALFFGRKAQLKTLQQEFDKPNLLGSHWGVYGVRRSGKTALIQHFIFQKEIELKNNNQPYFTFSYTGKKEKGTIENAEAALRDLIYQAKLFLKEYGYETYIPDYEHLLKTDNPNHWEKFFENLVVTIGFLKRTTGKKVFVFCFFDEIAWMSKDDSFIEAYSIYLNQNKVSLQYVMNFLACSSNSWIKTRIFKNTTGFFERFRKIKIEPFSFAEIKSFFALHNWISDEKEILKYYLLFGGFIKYYKEVELNLLKPLHENIDVLLEKTDFLKDEFDVFFKGVFSERKLYKEIVQEVLSKQTVSFAELTSKIETKHKKNSKNIERQINELKHTDVVQEVQFLGERRLYCCLPHFHLFYRFLKEKKITSQTIHQWRGDMFELYVLDNIKSIAQKLNINGELDVKLDLKLTDDGSGIISDNLNKDRESSDSKKSKQAILAQYDLVIEVKDKNWRADRKRQFFTIELKFHDGRNFVSYDYIKFAKRKANALKIFFEHTLPTKQEITVLPIILTTNQAGEDVLNIFDYL